MTKNKFFTLCESSRLITPIWGYIIDLIANEIDLDNKEEYLILFTILFSLVNDGNLAMNLDKDKLKEKWNKKLNENRILLDESNLLNEEEYDLLTNRSISAIDNYLDKLNEETFPNLFSSKGMFKIENGWIYIKKYYYSKTNLSKSIDRLFSFKQDKKCEFDYKQYIENPNFKLKEAQEKAVKEGFNKNLIVTGGPGTGKTTTVLFLLLGILVDNPNQEIYLTAPSGKAASRMKDSIINGLNCLKDDFQIEYPRIYEKIRSLEGKTIHSLLEIKGNTFSKNEKNQFPLNSIFVIDEASMIDVEIFNSLLKAIPTGSRIFIMGDKNQLPSVEAGAVFADLLANKDLKSNIIELNESNRFKEGSTIYNLAYAINNNLDLPIKSDEWKSYDQFKILFEEDYPVYYYLNEFDKIKEEDKIHYIVDQWLEAFYKDIKDKCYDIELDLNDEQVAKNKLNTLFKDVENAKILCAENQGVRGVETINRYIKHKLFPKSYDLTCGDLVMITKNNKSLDLSNGDSGVMVKFKDDETLYFMVKKSSTLYDVDEKAEDRIFKLYDYLFYPLRMISYKEISLSYAITIHKSQGSDYKNILVILPTKKGHPLLNRQIVYTAITRTKGSTYIFSSLNALNEAKVTMLERDTNLFID